MQITYIGSHDEVEIAATGQTVRKGESIDVPSAIAGRPPAARVAAAFAALVAATEAVDHEEAKALREEIASLDFGAGLLAQDSNWVHAKKTKPVDPPKDGE